MSTVFAGRRRSLFVACLLASSGCVRSCSYEDKAAAPSQEAVQKPEPSTPAKELSPEQLEDLKRLSDAISSAKNEPPAPPPLVDVSEVFPDASRERKERVEERARLAALQKELSSKTSSGSSDAVATREDLVPLFAGTLHGFKAEADAADGPTEAGDSPVRVVSRLYKKGDAELYVKVTDTSKAAFMRAPVLERLTYENGEVDGFLHGRFVEGYPAVAQYFPDAKRSQLVALVGGRYIVEIRMAPTESAYEAQKVFASLPLAKLARPDEAPRKSGK